MYGRSTVTWEGRAISHYEVREPLGTGGMSVVHRGWDRRLARPVALKFLAPELCRDAEARARFLREAHAASTLDHPNICSVHEVDETPDGQPFIAMACYDGPSLRDLLREGPLPVGRSVALALQVARGLSWAHAHGVLHRDVKPANLLVTRGDTVKIVDFGLAKLAEETRITRTGMPLGTASYMSPEQARGGEVDARTDVWSLGAVLFEMLTARRPFEGSDVTLVVHAVLHRPPPRVAALRPEVPRAVERVVEKALAKDPAQRYPSMEALAEALAALVRRPPKLRPGTHRPRLPRLGRATWTRRRVATAALVAGLAATAFALWRPGAGAGQPVRALAVLPLEDLSPGALEPGFSDAMTDGIIGELQQVEGLRVISRSSVMPFVGTDATLPEIADALDVDAVVEGSVVREGDTVRAAARLVRAHPEEALWAGTVERDLSDVLALHAEVARRLVDAAGVPLSPEARARTRNGAHPEVDPEAYLLYVRGRHHWNLGYHTLEGDERARGFFEDAIEKDPGFAAAWAGLADTWLTPGCHGLVSPVEALSHARAAVTRALELDPNSAEALTSYAHMVWEFDYDWEAGEQAFRKAIELNPSYAPAHHLYAAGLLGRAQRWDEAIAHMRRALELNPLSANASVDVAMVLDQAGHFEEADAQLAETRRAFPEWDPTSDLVGTAHRRHRWAEVVRLTEHLPLDAITVSYWSFVARAYVELGREAEARALLDRLEDADIYIPGTTLASIHVMLGEVEPALDLLEAARARHETGLTALLNSETLMRLQGHPRFDALLKQVGPPQ